MRDDYRGKDLTTNDSIVDALDKMRHTVIDNDGREMDFLAGIRKRGSSCGIHLVTNSKTIQRVVQGSPADLLRLAKGDVITHVDGEADEGKMVGLLGGDERIGSVCKISFLRCPSSPPSSSATPPSSRLHSHEPLSPKRCARPHVAIRTE